MNRAGWWVVNTLARTLEPDERDAVLGDLAEAGASAGMALRDLCGLIIRRQAALWQDWHPWLALVALALPVGVLLSFQYRNLNAAMDLFLWIARNYSTIDPAVLQSTGLTLGSGFAGLASGAILLASCSWISGFVLASLSRRAVWINGPLFCLVMLAGFRLSTPLNRPFNYDAGELFPLSFYRVILPFLMQTALSVLPAVWGMRRARRSIELPLLRTISWVVLLAVGMLWRGWFVRNPRGISLVFNWPVVYLAIYTIRRHWRRKTIEGEPL